MRTGLMRMAHIIAVGCGLALFSQSTWGDVVVNMPAPPKATPRARIIVVPPPVIGSPPQKVVVTAGDIALQRYSRARTQPNDTYGPAYAPGIRSFPRYDSHWPFFFGHGFFFHGHHHHHHLCK